jgi:DNA-binding CsgD family transcriptional regulator
MRGEDRQQPKLFSYVSPEQRVPPTHPLRTIRQLVDRALGEVSPRFDALYAAGGRPSIPPEQLLRALLLQVLYTIRSERQLMEQGDPRSRARRHLCESRRLRRRAAGLRAATGPPAALTYREREVLQLLVEGKRTKQVAGFLRISVKTAEFHRMRIMKKLDIYEMAGLVRYAIRTGLIEP